MPRSNILNVVVVKVMSLSVFPFQVPAHLQNSWESYYMEILMVTGLLAYIMNYIIGKNKNSRLATAWFNSHRELLESNFALVGDDGTSKDAVSTGKLNQENEHIYNLWCSGRVCCEGMLIQLKVFTVCVSKREKVFV